MREREREREQCRARMAASLLFLAAILSSYLTVLSVSTPSISQIGTETSRGNNHENHHLIRDLEKAKLKIARLESIFEETIQDINAKGLHLKESQKLIEEMTPEMNRLQSALSSLKGKSSRAGERINQLEEEVRLLWATLRKSNFELHLLESKAEDAENRLELVTSQVETMAAIVTEQWIQIQQLEQALHMAEMRALKVKREVSSTRCRFLKESALGSYVSPALHQLETILSAAKKYHHELQGFIQQEMERNEFTAALANKEVVFFVASAIITFPIMSAWMLLSSQFS